jgi:hypothetical protein
MHPGLGLAMAAEEVASVASEPKEKKFGEILQVKD